MEPRHRPLRSARPDRGFTLVEILIAIVLVGILSAVVVVGVGQLVSKGSTASCNASADAARTASLAYYTDTLAHPTTFTQLTGASLLSAPSGAFVGGTTMTVGGDSGWTLTLTPGASGASPTFACSASGVIAGPLPVAGAALWLDASKASSITMTGSNVTRWADQSGNAVDATASGTFGPTMATIGGRSYVSFNGTNQQMALTLGGSKTTIIAVVRSTASTWGSYGSVLENRSGGRLGNIFESGSTTFHFNPFPTSVRRNGAALASPFDMAPVNQFMVMTVVPSRPTASNQLSIGALENSWFSPIQVAELIVYPTTLTTTDLQAVEQYLTAKWAIS